MNAPLGVVHRLARLLDQRVVEHALHDGVAEEPKVLQRLLDPAVAPPVDGGGRDGSRVGCAHRSNLQTDMGEGGLVNQRLEPSALTCRLVADVRSILARPWVYELFSRVVGGEHARVTLVRKHIRPWGGARILDLGCGPGTLLGYLGHVEYVGVDVSEDYIAQARSQFGGRASFRVGDATRVDPDLRNFDLVLAFGVLHHLDDTEASRLFAHARGALRDGGRLVTLDNTLLPDEPRLIADRIVSWDRGDQVRSPSAYEQLARSAFSSVESTIYRDLLRMPYTHCVLECVN